MNRLLLAIMAVVLISSCATSTSEERIAGLPNDVLMGRPIREPKGRITQFHGETWFTISGGTATACIPGTFFLERPVKNAKPPELQTPISTDKLVALLGQPDKISSNGKLWIYYGSDQGSLLSTRK